MLKESVQDALNKQINAELYSSYLYLSMSAHFENTGLDGAANWMRCQAQEEVLHAMMFYKYVADRGGRVELTAIDGPPTEWKSPLAVFEEAYAHEQKVTSLIDGLVDLAIKEKDHGTNQVLQWFVKEQVEEEASADQVVQRLKLVESGGGGGLFMVDRELAQRAFTPPASLDAVGGGE